MFQSTPDLVNRENVTSTSPRFGRSAFQSTPDLVNRENYHKRKCCAIAADVSIHSRFS